MISLTRLAATGALLAALANGCAPRDEKSTVAGTVTLDGTVLKTGQIRFVPLDGSSPSAGAVIVDGRYTVETTPGEKTIEISSPKEGRARQMYDDAPEASNLRGDLVPARYNAQTELTLEVRLGSQNQDFELTSRGR